MRKRNHGAARLSAGMREALAKALEHDGTLVRWEGGFWTHPGATSVGTSMGCRVPAWSCAWGTVRALLDRRLATVSERRQTRGGGEFAVRVELTEAGRAADCAAPASPAT